jgi:hypothetical protein
MGLANRPAPYRPEGDQVNERQGENGAGYVFSFAFLKQAKGDK